MALLLRGSGSALQYWRVVHTGAQYSAFSVDSTTRERCAEGYYCQIGSTVPERCSYAPPPRPIPTLQPRSQCFSATQPTAGCASGLSPPGPHCGTQCCPLATHTYYTTMQRRTCRFGEWIIHCPEGTSRPGAPRGSGVVILLLLYAQP